MPAPPVGIPLRHGRNRKFRLPCDSPGPAGPCGVEAVACRLCWPRSCASPFAIRVTKQVLGTKCALPGAQLSALDRAPSQSLSATHSAWLSPLSNHQPMFLCVQCALERRTGARGARRPHGRAPCTRAPDQAVPLSARRRPGRALAAVLGARRGRGRLRRHRRVPSMRSAPAPARRRHARRGRPGRAAGRSRRAQGRAARQPGQQRIVAVLAGPRLARGVARGLPRHGRRRWPACPRTTRAPRRRARACWATPGSAPGAAARPLTRWWQSSSACRRAAASQARPTLFYPTLPRRRISAQCTAQNLWCKAGLSAARIYQDACGRVNPFVQQLVAAEPKPARQPKRRCMASLHTCAFTAADRRRHVHTAAVLRLTCAWWPAGDAACAIDKPALPDAWTY